MTGLQSFCTSFEGFRRIATGELHEVALKTKLVLERGEKSPVLVFDNRTSELIEIDFRGSDADVLQRLEMRKLQAASRQVEVTETAVPRGPGRPKLGVVAREVTLLPRHWDWLNNQPGGASVALRKLVDEARKANEGKDRVRAAQDAAYRFLTVIAGNLPGYEEAIRAIFALDTPHFDEVITTWPDDVRQHAKMLFKQACEVG
jgi:hypothetical protein